MIESADAVDDERPLVGAGGPGRVAPGVGRVPAVGFVARRLPSKRWDDLGTPMNVFVAGLMGAGALMSVLVGLTESISSARGKERLYRKAHPVAAMMAEGAVGGHESVTASATGLRPRHHYVLGSIVLGLIAAFLVVSSSDAYFSENGSVGGWGLSLSGAVTVAAMSGVAGVAALRWPRVPAVVRRIAPGHPARATSTWASVPRSGRVAIATLLSLVALGALLVIFAESWLLEIDERIYFDWLEAGQDVDRIGPEWLNTLGQPIPSITIALVVSLMTLRCRVVATAFPLAIVAGGLANLTLSWLTHRERPPFSAHAGEFTSYPGGHSIQLPLLLLILPLAVYLVSGSKLARNITGAIALSVWAVAWIDTVRTGGHWPSDQVAGLFIALSLLIVVYSVAHQATHHGSCDACVNREHAMSEEMQAPS